MSNGFVNTAKSRDDSVPPNTQFALDDIREALESNGYYSARGWLTNKQGKSIEITLDDRSEMDKLLSLGLDFPRQHCHVEFEELESAHIKITVGNVPIEAKNIDLIIVIEAHGGRIEKVTPYTQSFRGKQVATGKRIFMIAKSRDFTPLPKVVRLFGGRFISFRHQGQPDEGDTWRQPRGSHQRPPSSYAQAARREVTYPPEEYYQDDDQSRNTPGEPSEAGDSHDPFEFIEFTSQDAVDWEELVPITLPDNIHRFTRPYFHWLIEHASRTDFHIHHNSVRLWEACIQKIDAMEGREEVPEDPARQESENPSPQPQAEPAAQVTAIDKKEPLSEKCRRALQLHTAVATDAEMDTTTAPTPPSDPRLSEKVDAAGETSSTHQCDIEEPLEESLSWEADPPAYQIDISAICTRPLAPLTTIDMEEEEGHEPDITTQDLATALALGIPQGESPAQLEDGEISVEEVPAPDTPLIPTLPFTEADIVADYANQDSASQSLAPEAEDHHQKRKKASGTDSDAGSAPTKKLNIPEGFPVQIGEYSHHFTQTELRGLKRKVAENGKLTHADVFNDFLLRNCKINPILNHHSGHGKSAQRRTDEYHAFLLYQQLGPASTAWCSNPHLSDISESVKSQWDDITPDSLEKRRQKSEKYIDMLNHKRRDRKS